VFVQELLKRPELLGLFPRSGRFFLRTSRLPIAARGQDICRTKNATMTLRKFGFDKCTVTLSVDRCVRSAQ
jgi:hypothetical protein